MRLRRRPINKDVEKQVLIGFVTSDKICHTLKNLLDPKLFQLSVGQTVSRWIKEYYSLYNRAPKGDIQEIYLAERNNLDEEVSLDVSQFLQSLSQDYLNNPPNEDYLLNQATVYLKKQNFMTGIKEAGLILESSNGDMAALSAAEAAVARSQKNITKSVPSLDPCNISFAVTCLEEDKEPLLVMPEPLGKFIGPLHRGYVLGIMGSQKRGKTWWAQNFVITALEERLRVIFVSLEMPSKKLVKRFWQQLGCFPEKNGNYEFPFFDCTKNKYNTCKKPERVCTIKYGEQGYIPCEICKEKEGLDLSISLHPYHKKGIDAQNLTKKMKNFHLMYGKNNIRFLCYPMFSANLSQILNDIDILEWRENFIPDVIVLDYPAILKEERETGKEYSAFGETWKTIKRIAEEKQVLFIAPLQTDRKGGDSEHLKISHTAGYVQIIAHMDICITLNQNESDYEQRVMRIGKIADRWTEMQPGKEIIALSQLQCGQPYLGSRLVRRKTNKS